MTTKEQTYEPKILLYGRLKKNPELYSAVICIDKEGVKEGMKSFQEFDLYFLKKADQTTLLDIKKELQ